MQITGVVAVGSCSFAYRVQRFLDERILPNEQTYLDQLVGTDDWQQWKIPPIMEELKAEAKELGLWNLFLPDEKYGAGLDNRDYAPVAEVAGHITPMPGGTGPMTIACLLENTLTAAQLQGAFPA